MSNEQLSTATVTRLFNIKDVLFQLSSATPKSLPMRMLKLTNEVGELAGAVDILEGNAGTKYRQATTPLDDVLEESVDVMLVNASLIIQFAQEHGYTLTEVLDVVDRKLEKWQHVLTLDGLPNGD